MKGTKSVAARAKYNHETTLEKRILVILRMAVKLK